MRYLGGKKRQAKQIVEAIRRLRPNFTTYVEPFCGAMWSAVAVMKAFPGRRYILNDVNQYLMCFWRVARDGWDPPRRVTEDDYNWYREHKPVDDPRTGYVGFAMSFGGKFFGGWARDAAGARRFDREASKASLDKIQVLRRSDVELHCGDFRACPFPLGCLAYLDPPYEKRTRQAPGNQFDRGAYYSWAEQQARRATVLATEFVNPLGWTVLHDYGDTVVRHLNGKPPDGTRELLLLVRKGAK